MEQANWFIIPIAGLLPLILGYIWYHPNVLGTKLAQINGAPIEGKRSIGRVALIYLFGILLAYVLTLMSIHQVAIYQLFFMDPDLSNSNSEYNLYINEFMEKYGNRHRSFIHGVVHGTEAGLIFSLALIGITTLLQNEPLKKVWIHIGFCILCCSLMAGLTCAFF
ncbi:MAG: DUF1761 domain-containing protein [Bacteroidota bacterium]